MIQELKKLISVTKEEYERDYIPLIRQINLNQNEETVHVFEQAIAMLKYRRACMLPRGADTETCYVQQEAWTYACFAALLVKKNMVVLSESALQYLQKYPTVWEAYSNFMDKTPAADNPLLLLSEQSRCR